jgi:membrane protein YqaA with SNARE-associated domain
MSALAICLSTFLGCLIGSFVPLVNTELVVLGAAAAAPPALLLPLILIAATTQMAAKSVLYFAGGGLLRVSWSRRLSAALERGRGTQRSGSLFLFVSALTGFPPFYLVSIASGAMRVPFARFLIIGMAGRTIRFIAVVMLPHFLKSA